MDNLKDQIVKIRKPHKCWGCTREFQIGAKLRVLAAADGGTVNTSYWCSTCMDYWDTHMKDSDGVGFGELRDEAGKDWTELRDKLEGTK